MLQAQALLPRLVRRSHNHQVSELRRSVAAELATGQASSHLALLAPAALPPEWPSRGRQPALSGRRASGGLGVGLDGIGAAGGGDPGESAGYGLVEVPLLVLFELVMVPAQRTEVATAGRAVLVERPGVIGVASPGGLATRRKPAGQVPQAHELAEPGRHLVGRAGLGVSTSSGGGIGCGSFGCLGGCFAGSRDDRCSTVPRLHRLPLTAAALTPPRCGQRCA